MFDFENAKEDKRSRKNGFAPGMYTCKCSCGVSFYGDKRSIECADCAYDNELQVKKALDRVLYCCDGLNKDYNKSNFGDANDWLRRIAMAYSNYQEAVDEKEAPNMCIHRKAV